jgi:pimeloyl-ACP methyl ester carboxylesterase
VIAGASLGAAVAVAVAVAARHPRRVRDLFPFCGFARRRTTLWLCPETWASLHSRRDDELNAFLTSLSFSEDYLAAHTPEAARHPDRPAGGIRAWNRPPDRLGLGVDIRGDLAAVTAPTLIVAATGDRFVAPEHSLELADAIPGARLAAVRGGHAASSARPWRRCPVYCP